MCTINTIDRHYKGFTLIEILVVMFIVGIMLLAVGSRYTPSKHQDSLLNNVNTLQGKLQYALDYTTFKREVLALTIHQTGYYFSNYHKNASQTWQPIATQKDLNPVLWQDLERINHIDMVIDNTSVVIDDLKDLTQEEKEKLPPHVIIFPNYETTDFSITLLDKEGEEKSLDSKTINRIR